MYHMLRVGCELNSHGPILGFYKSSLWELSHRISMSISFHLELSWRRWFQFPKVVNHSMLSGYNEAIMRPYTFFMHFSIYKL